MNTTALLTPILDGAIRSIKFFNGRLLTGEDLTQEQTAEWQARERLGLATGDGVVFGLEVTITPPASTTSAPTVTVQPGLAINRRGKALRLCSPINVTLVQPAPTLTTAATPTTSAAGGFVICQPPSTTAYVASGNVYVLTLCPIQIPYGRTQISNLGSGADACNTQYLVDAVELRLLPLTGLTQAQLQDTAHLRNVVAGNLFGAGNALAFATDPFGAAQPTTTPLDTLTGSQLMASEVPLATLYWTASGGLVYVDMWSVRRPVAGPVGEWPWGVRLDERRLAHAAARLLQFQEAIDDLGAAASAAASAPPLATIGAQAMFNDLPPAGVMPINGTNGFVTSTFFSGITIRDPIFVEGSKVEAILRTSLGYPPINLSSGEMIFIYHVRENRFAIDFPTAGATAPVEYIVFASGQMPYFGDARFDISHWDYSSYA